MSRLSKRIIVSVVSVLCLALVAAGVWLIGGASAVNAAEATAEDLKTLIQASTMPGLLGEGYLANGGWERGGLKGPIDYQQLLADALGITVEELQAAYQEARGAAIEQAVEQGLITQEQADEMLSRDGTGRRGFGFRAFGRDPKGLAGGEIDEGALLAEALGITVDELQAAREKANQAALEQAIAEGIITQEQADEMQSRRELLGNADLMSYLNPEALLAKVLGLTVEELQAALEGGKTTFDLIAESELDAATLRERLTEAYDEALAQAVADGVITQEQADALPEGPGFGFGGRHGFGGRGKFGERPNPEDMPDLEEHPFFGERGKFGEWPNPEDMPDSGEHPFFGGHGRFGGRPWSPGTDAEDQDIEPDSTL